MQRKAYPADLTDPHWHTIQQALPPPEGGKRGRPPKYPRGQTGNALSCRARGLCPAPVAPRSAPAGAGPGAPLPLARRGRPRSGS